MLKVHTEFEQLNHIKMLVFSLRKVYKSDYKLFCEMANQIPFYIYSNYRQNLNYTFYNETVESIWENPELLKKNAIGMIRQISNPDLFEFAHRRIIKLDQSNDNNLVNSNFLQINHKAINEFVVVNKVIVNELEFLNVCYQFSNLGIIGQKFSKVIENVVTDSKKWMQFNSLTKKEKEVLRLIVEGNSYKEIASELFVSEHTIRTHSERIKKKIEANDIISIMKFGLAFDLIQAL